MRLLPVTLLCLLPVACGDGEATPVDAAPAADRAVAFDCALPASAMLTPSEMRGIAGAPSAVVTWDGATCGVDSDDTRPDAILIVVDVMSFGGMLALPLGDWGVEEASSGLPMIPVDTEITFQLSLDSSRLFVALWTDGSTLRLTGFRAF